MQIRLDIQRDVLMAKFLAMETALATSNRILESVQATMDAMFSSKK
jgi:hypothetical protein